MDKNNNSNKNIITYKNMYKTQIFNSHLSRVHFILLP